MIRFLRVSNVPGGLPWIPRCQVGSALPSSSWGRHCRPKHARRAPDELRTSGSVLLWHLRASPDAAQGHKTSQSQNRQHG